jgi:hypothetical protein
MKYRQNTIFFFRADAFQAELARMGIDESTINQRLKQWECLLITKQENAKIGLDVLRKCIAEFNLRNNLDKMESLVL